MRHNFTVVVSKGLENVLQTELRSIGLQNVIAEQGAVRFQGRYKDGLKACLWTRIGSRVFLRLHRFSCYNADELYTGVQKVDWSEHLRATGTLWIDFVGYGKQLRNSLFAARKVKDAIVDQLTMIN